MIDIYALKIEVRKILKYLIWSFRLLTFSDVMFAESDFCWIFCSFFDNQSKIFEIA